MSSTMKFVPTKENIGLMIAGGVLLLISGAMTFGGFNMLKSQQIDPTKQQFYKPDIKNPLETGCNSAIVKDGMQPCWQDSKNICWIVKQDDDVAPSDCLQLVPKSKWITMWIFAGIVGLLGFILLMVGVGKGSTAAKDLLPKTSSPSAANKSPSKSIELTEYKSNSDNKSD